MLTIHHASVSAPSSEDQHRQRKHYGRKGCSTVQVILFLADDVLGSENKTGVLLGTNMRSIIYSSE